MHRRTFLLLTFRGVWLVEGPTSSGGGSSSRRSRNRSRSRRRRSSRSRRRRRRRSSSSRRRRSCRSCRGRSRIRSSRSNRKSRSNRSSRSSRTSAYTGQEAGRTFDPAPDISFGPIKDPKKAGSTYQEHSCTTIKSSIAERPLLAMIEDVEDTMMKIHDIPLKPEERAAGKYFHLWMLGVTSSARGRRVGSKLLRHSLLLAKQHGFKMAFAECTGAISTHILKKHCSPRLDAFVDYASWHKMPTSEEVKNLPAAGHAGMSLLSIDLVHFMWKDS